MDIGSHSSFVSEVEARGPFVEVERGEHDDGATSAIRERRKERTRKERDRGGGREGPQSDLDQGVLY